MNRLITMLSGRAYLAAALAVSALVAGVLLGACDTAGNTSAPSSTAATVDAAARGQVVYMRYCNGCHPGGGRGAGPAIVDEIAEASDERLMFTVRNGRGRMPAFGPDVISDASLNDLVAYMRTLQER